MIDIRVGRDLWFDEAVTDGILFHIGCYTSAGGGQGEGVTLARRDPGTGALIGLGVVATAESPSFLAYHPDLPVLYAVNEAERGTVSAWSVSPDGRLEPMGIRSTGGAYPCHLAISPDGRRLAIANYGSGSVAVHPIDRTGLPGDHTDLVVHRTVAVPGQDPRRQQAAHAHMVSWWDTARLVAVDLGADAVFQYVAGETDGRLRAAGEVLRTPPGTGPRHLACGPSGWLYLAGELDGSVSAYQIDPRSGEPRQRDRVAASRYAGPVQPSGITVGPDRRFLYLANRGPDTIAVFALDTGVPRHCAEVPCRGTWPRHFTIRDGFLYVANERSHTVAAFRVVPATGVPEPLEPVLEMPSPTCIVSRTAPVK